MSRSPATRSGLLALQRRLSRVQRGAGLLRRKREALAAELFQAARPAMDARQAIADQARQATLRLHGALAVEGEDGLRATGRPARRLEVLVQATEVWGLPAVSISERSPARRSLAARELDPASCGPAAAEAAEAWETLVDLLLDAAPREHRVRTLGEQLQHTSRQVHVLEQQLAPQLQGRVTAVTRVLEEREREEHDRLRLLLRRRAGR